MTTAQFPTLTVELGLGSAPANTWIVFQPSNVTTTAAGFDTFTFGAGVAFTDVTADVRDLQTHRGRQRSADRFAAGACTFTLDDTTGSYFGNANLVPNVKVQVHANWQGVDYWLFAGYVDSITPNWTPGQYSYSTITITATDAFKPLQAYKPPTPLGSPVGAGEDTGARVNRILDEVATFTTSRDIDTGNSTLQGTTESQSALDDIYAAVDSELGQFYINPNGSIRFENRQYRLTNPTSYTSQVTLADAYLVSDYATQVKNDQPLIYWRLDEPSGTRAADSSRNGNDGTYTNAPTLGATGLLTGDTDKAATFTALSSQYVVQNVGIAARSFSSGFTMEAIIKPTATQFVNGGSICGIGRSADVTEATLYAADFGGGAIHAAMVVELPAGTQVLNLHGTTTLSAGNTYHIVGTYDGTTAKLYVNGALDASSTAIRGTYSIVHTDTFFAAADFEGDYYDGTLDEVAFYPSVLTPTRIAAHYTAMTTAPVSATDLIETAPVTLDATLVQNRVTGQNTGGTAQTASDATSITANFTVDYSNTSLILQTDADALNWANWRLWLYKNARRRVDSASIRPLGDPSRLWPEVLGRAFSDRVTVALRPPRGSAYSSDFFVEGIDHQITTSPQDWVTTYHLSDATQYNNVLLFDVSGHDVFDTNTFAQF